MIEKWHERTNSVGFKIIFSLVSLSFVLAGIGGGIVGANTSAVKVNGQEIFLMQRIANKLLCQTKWEHNSGTY